MSAHAPSSKTRGLGKMEAATPARMAEMDVVGASRLSTDAILQILRRENEQRLSASTRAEFAAVRDQPDGWLGVVEQLQRRVARECGVTEAVGLAAMRCAETLLTPLCPLEKARWTQENTQ